MAGLHGNNAQWISARVICHQGFNISPEWIYFQPDGTFLKAFDWIDNKGNAKEEPYDEHIQERIDAARKAYIIGLKVCLLKDQDQMSSYSPYVVPKWMELGLTDLMKAHFSEHTTSSNGMHEKICAEFPDRDEDVQFVMGLIDYAIDQQKQLQI